MLFLLVGKLHKADRVKKEPLNLNKIECWGHIQIDFGFMVKCSHRQGDPKSDIQSPKEATELPLDVSPVATHSQQTGETSGSQVSSSNPKPGVSASKVPEIPLGT